MSLAVLVEQVGEVLGRGHALFGQPPASGGGAASDAAGAVARAGQAVADGQQRVGALAGAGPRSYLGFTAEAEPALRDAADSDATLAASLRDAAGSDRAGRQSSGSVVNGAATDTAALAPATRTAAGQRALITALRLRVAQQQQLIAAQRLRDARLAAMVRTLGYGRTGAVGGAMPLGGMPFGGGGFSGGGGGGGGVPGLSGLSGLSSSLPSLIGRGAGGRRPPRAVVTAAAAIPGAGGGGSGPGQGAVRAALSKLGRPYVWGAKGPSVFDCSGLTQWAWRQAGVELGPNTYTQIQEGLPVARGQVQAGDLIFPLDSFGEGGQPGPGHVQLAISPTQVVHAPQTGDVVRVAPMPERYVARRPVRLDAV